jgi:hypothetical protein
LKCVECGQTASVAVWACAEQPQIRAVLEYSRGLMNGHGLETEQRMVTDYRKNNEWSRITERSTNGHGLETEKRNVASDVNEDRGRKEDATDRSCKQCKDCKLG